MFEGCGHAELLQVQWSRYSAPCFLNSQLPENDLLVYYMYIYIYIQFQIPCMDMRGPRTSIYMYIIHIYVYIRWLIIYFLT
jgi:hypothetical protein